MGTEVAHVRPPVFAPDGIREESRTENAHELMRELADLGVHVELARGKTKRGRTKVDLRINDPESAMTNELWARVRSNRARLIDHLRLTGQGGRVTPAEENR